MKSKVKKAPGLLRWIASGISWMAVILLAVGLLVRLTVRDHFRFTAPVYYGTPWFALAIGAVTCLVHWWSQRRARIAFAVILALCVTMWVVRFFRLGPHERPAASFRVSYWNVARPTWRLDGVFNEVDSWHAAINVFGEQRADEIMAPPWLTHFAPRHATRLEREMFLVTPEVPKITHGGSLGGRGGSEIATIHVQGREVNVLMVDFDSFPTHSRQPAFERLYQIVEAYDTKPLIVIGDFNTPADSVYFDRLRAKLSNAFETAGHGYAATWPMPVPVMRIDHIWTNHYLRAVRCEHIVSAYSDHRPVVADFVFTKD